MSLNKYTPEFKRKVIDLHKKCGRTYKSIADEYGVSKASISRWCSESEKNLQLMKTHNLEKENLSLKQENRVCHLWFEFGNHICGFLQMFHPTGM